MSEYDVYAGLKPLTEIVYVPEGTIQEFRVLLAEAIATYHVTPSNALNDRCPLDVWLEQMRLHGHSQARDIDQYLRCIGDLDYVEFRRDGCGQHGLMYSDGEGNEALLADLAAASGEAQDTVNPSFRVKVKSYPDDLGFVSVWNPHRRRYVDVPCTRRRYAAGKPRWLHERVQEHARLLGIAFYGDDEQAVENAMIEAHAGLCVVIENTAPEAKARERRTMGRLFDAPNVRRFLGDSVNYVRVQPSPSGMETKVEHDLGAETRRDGMIEPQRRRRGGENVKREGRDAAGRRREASDAAAKESGGRGAGKGGKVGSKRTGGRPSAPAAPMPRAGFK